MSSKLAAQQIDQRHGPFKNTPEDQDRRQELIDDLLEDWRREDYQERQERGIDEIEEIPNCDNFDTGEGRYHGRM